MMVDPKRGFINPDITDNGGTTPRDYFYERVATYGIKTATKVQRKLEPYVPEKKVDITGPIEIITYNGIGPVPEYKYQPILGKDYNEGYAYKWRCNKCFDYFNGSPKDHFEKKHPPKYVSSRTGPMWIGHFFIWLSGCIYRLQTSEKETSVGIGPIPVLMFLMLIFEIVHILFFAGWFLP